MTLFRTVEPAVEPLTLVEVKQNLRIDHAGDDDLLSGLVTAAREEVEASTGLALIEQHWRCLLDCLPASRLVPLARHPVREINSVTVYGAEGEASLVAPENYRLDAASRPARLYFLTDLRPEIAMNGIEIDFIAGFGEAGTDVPDLIKRAMHLLVAHWYEFRTDFAAGDQPVSFPQSYARLIAPYRMRRL